MDLKYEVKIYWSDDDNCFIAEMPQLPGCVADGETYKEALKNIEKIRDIWISNAEKYGDIIPKPKKVRRIARKKLSHA
jgi:predicted RNase H-like HicB family nuclease